MVGGLEVLEVIGEGGGTTEDVGSLWSNALTLCFFFWGRGGGRGERKTRTQQSLCVWVGVWGGGGGGGGGGDCVVLTSAMATQEGVVEEDAELNSGFGPDDGVLRRVTCKHTLMYHTATKSNR